MPSHIHTRRKNTCPHRKRSTQQGAQECILSCHVKYKRCALNCHYLKYPYCFLPDTSMLWLELTYTRWLKREHNIMLLWKGKWTQIYIKREGQFFWQNNMTSNAHCSITLVRSIHMLSLLLYHPVYSEYGYEKYPSVRQEESNIFST